MSPILDTNSQPSTIRPHQFTVPGKHISPQVGHSVKMQVEHYAAGPYWGVRIETHSVFAFLLKLNSSLDVCRRASLSIFTILHHGVSRAFC